MQENPGWPKVIGILSIIFGFLGIVFGVGSVALMPLWTGMMEGALDGAPPPPSMQLTPLLLGLTAAGGLLNLLLIVAGFMTIARKPAGRTAHLVYAVLCAFSAIAVLFYQQQTQAAVLQWAKEYPDNPVAQSMTSGAQAAGQLIGLIIGMAIGLAWPVFCIIWFGMVKRHADSMGAPPELTA
jgi:hypothetical protein